MNMRDRTVTAWYRTGECRIVPWWFGLMRAEFLERRDFKERESGDVMEYQIRWVGSGRFPSEFDGGSAFGFWSTLATPPDDMRYGQRSLWRRFVTYFGKPKEDRL